MNISGFQLQHSAQSTFCHNAYCSAVIPLCFAGISPTCARNRSSTEWCHFSFGEHVCQECVHFLSLSLTKSKLTATHSIWRFRISSSQRLWMQKSSNLGRRRVFSVEEFIAGNLLPWWLQCVKCGCWRQVVAHTPVGSMESPYHPDGFTCALVSKGLDDPCSWPLDDRSVLVRSRPRDFLASMKIHAWLQGSPTFNFLASYGVDLCGLSPDALPGVRDEVISESLNYSESCYMIADEQGPFSVVDIRAWERVVFPEMTRFHTLYLAVRNLVLYLWAKNPKCFLTTKYVANHCFVRGLLRIVLCDQWIPHLIEEFTCRGLINVGVCSPPSVSSALSPVDASVQFTTNTWSEENELRIRVIGDLGLTGAVATRQILNGLLARVKLTNRDRKSHVVTPTSDAFSVRFHPVSATHISSFTETSRALGELGIKLAADSSKNGVSGSFSIGHVHKTATNNGLCDPYMNQFVEKWRHVTVGESEDPLQTASMQLILPVHMWSDRVYIHPNHPLKFLTTQANMSLRPLGKCVLLHAAVSENSSTTPLKLVSDEVSIRMEFHVEAVLDMVAQLGEQHINGDRLSEDGKPGLCSVQDCWDIRDSEVRTRLTDLTRSELERQLIEFFLAEVEYDLTEPLVTNNPYHFLTRHIHNRMRSWPCPTARLDCLPSFRYAEFTMDDGLGSGSNSAGPDNRENGMVGHPHLVTPNKPSDGPISALCISMLRDACCWSSGVLRVTVNRDLSCPMETSEFGGETNQSTCVASTPRVDQDKPMDVHTKSGLEMKDSAGNSITISTAEGEQEFTNWVVLTCPTEQLRVNFYDVSSRDSFNDQSAVPGTLVLDLPTSLKPLIMRDECDPCSSEPMKTSQILSGFNTECNTVSPARLITVVLIYSTPWWRSDLCRLTTPNTMETDPTNDNIQAPFEWFAILPESRDNRGFCHTFRDLCPDLDRPGVLQTQLFGAAADHWWSNGDTLLTAAVHQFIQSHWVFDVVDADRELKLGSTSAISDPVSCHVARMQHSTKVLDEPGNQTVLDPVPYLIDCHGQIIRLRSNVWEELARRAHILIPDLFRPSTSVSADSDEPGGLHGLTECVQLTRSPGMDVLTSTVLDGLYVANVVLRCIPGLGSGSILNYPSFQSKLESSLTDSSTLLSDRSHTEDTHSTRGGSGRLEAGVPSARTQRFLRRVYKDSETNSLLETE